MLRNDKPGFKLQQAMISLHRMADKGLIRDFFFFFLSRSYMITLFYRIKLIKISTGLDKSNFDL